jgi:diguanylate cyclase (GGDEF)-like protein
MITNSTTTKIFNIFSFVVLILFSLPISVKAVQATEKKAPRLTNNILTTEEVSEKLQLAEQKKRSNPTLFKKLIIELNQQPNITKTHQYSLDFLNAYAFLYNGKNYKAKSKFEALLQSKASNLIKFKTNYLLIYLATATKNWQDGLQYVAANIKLLPAISNIESSQNSMLAIIMFYSQMGQYQLALSYIDQLSQQQLSAENNCGLTQLTLEARFNLNELKLNDSAFEPAIEKCMDADFLIPANTIRLYKAKLLLKEQKAEEVLDYISSFIEEVRTTQYPMLITEINNIIAKAYWQINDIDNAKSYANDALANNPNGTNLLKGVDTYFLLYQIAKQQQDFPLALNYYEKYSSVEKANLKGEKAKHLAFQLAEHNAFEQESQIKLLNEQNNALAAEQALAKTRATNKKLIILSLALIIVVFTFFGIRFWHTHKRVRQLAEYDLLTGIYNRGHFTQVTNSALKYCKNAEQDLSLIMFDLDHFKKVNDDFGHACGDWALKETIKVCKDIGRKNDVFARLGGEEFCLVLPSCNIDVAMLRAEACRIAIESIITEESGHDFAITASFGVTDVKRSGFDLDTLLADADMAAYDSKKSGRNKVTVHQVPFKDSEDKLDSSWSYK